MDLSLGPDADRIPGGGNTGEVAGASSELFVVN